MIIMQEGEPIKFLTCLHRYHAGCIDPWLYMKGTCPVCLMSIDPEPRDRDGDAPGADAARPRYGHLHSLGIVWTRPQFILVPMHILFVKRLGNGLFAAILEME
jgi:hypothetical protein